MHSCSVCQKPTAQICGGCHDRAYCGVSCQSYDWSKGNHAEYCSMVGAPVALPEQEMQILVNYMVEKGVTREAGENEAKYRERIQLSINRMKTNARKPMETDAEYGKRIAKQLKTNLGAQKRSLKKKEKGQNVEVKKSKQDDDEVQAQRDAIMQQRYEIMRQRRTEEARWSMEHAEWKRQANARKEAAEPFNPLKGITALEDMSAMYLAGKVTKQQIQDHLRVLWDMATGFRPGMDVATVNGRSVLNIVEDYVDSFESEGSDSEEVFRRNQRSDRINFTLVYDLRANELLDPVDIDNYLEDDDDVILYSK